MSLETIVTETVGNDTITDSEAGTKVILKTIGGEFVKKQQCKKVTSVCKLNSFSDKNQKWKLDGPMLKNKEGAWKSDESLSHLFYSSTLQKFL